MNYQTSYFGFGNTNNTNNTNYTNHLNTTNATTNTTTHNNAVSTKKMYRFSDIMIKQKLSYIKSRDEVTCVSKFSKTISIHNPFVVVSQDENAVINANTSGGMGIIGKMRLEDQVAKVKAVKNYIRLIDDAPITVYSTTTYKELTDMFKDTNVDYIFVLSTNGMCIGMITRSIMELVKLSNYENFSGYAFDIMLPIDNIRYFRLSDYDWKSLVTYTSIQLKQLLDEFKTNPIIPILCDNKKLLGVLTLQNVLKFYKYRSECLVDEFGRLLVAASIGVSQNYISRVDELVKAGVSILYIDVDNAYNNVIGMILKEIKTKYQSVTVIVGRVQCVEGYKYLCETGADGVIVGNTDDTGQFTLLQECYQIYQTYNVPIINYTGIDNSNTNHFKALVAGANCVMIADASNIQTYLKTIKSNMISVNSKTFEELMSTQPHYFCNV